jgi:hypothetical protein
MRHPDLTDLTRYAVGDTTDSRLEWHVESCSECAAEVERLRVGLGAILAVAKVPLDAAPDCLDEQALAGLAEGGLPPPQRDSYLAHLAVCARCRAAVSSVAYARSSEAIARELVSLDGAARPRWRRYALALGATAAATVALLLVSEPPAPVLVPPHREGLAPVGPAPVTISPAGPTRAVTVLRWHSVRGADRYRVTLFDEGGAVLYETALSDTVAALPEGVEIEAGRSYYWMVAARTDFDRWDTSALAEFSVDGMGR